MRKIIAAFNMTLDGICDHTAGIPDQEIHSHYTDLLNQADAILYGRITFYLMEYWLPYVRNPSGEKSMDDFARAIDKIPKIVFSHSLKDIAWKSAPLAVGELGKEVQKLKQQPGRDIIVGSRSLIVQLMNLQLIDEYQLCVYPVVSGRGLSLFENISNRIILKLTGVKTFSGGAVILYYKTAATD